MKGILGVFKTTIIGGIVFLVPLVLIVIVLGKGLGLIKTISEPMATFVPVDTLAGIAAVNIIGFVVLILFCFVAGLIARNSLASRVVENAETKFLWQMPGYAFIKGITESLSQNNAETSFIPVLCRFDDCWQPGFEVDQMDDGRIVVYMPGAPDPYSGSIIIMDAERIEVIDANMIATISCLRKLGHDSSQIFTKKG